MEQREFGRGAGSGLRCTCAVKQQPQQACTEGEKLPKNRTVSFGWQPVSVEYCDSPGRATVMGDPVTLSDDQMALLVQKLSEQLAPRLNPPAVRADPPGTLCRVV